MSLDELLRLVPPPAGVVPGTAEQWAAAERKCGLPFPTEYRQFVDAYGETCIGDLQVHGALSGLAQWSREEAASVRDWAVVNEELEYFPADFHPERPGLYPWGVDGSGTVFCWLTREGPDEWPIVVIRLGVDTSTWEFECSFSDFLLQYVRGDIPELAGPFVLPDPYPGPTPEEVEAEVRRRRAAAPARPPLGPGPAFDELLRLLPPRPGIIPGTAALWEAAEKECGLVFPAEYRRFVDAYGDGWIGSLQVENALTGLPNWSKSYAEVMRDEAVRWKQTRDYPAGFHPDRPGLFPWGTYGTVHFWWLTLGEPDEWPIIAIDTHRRKPQIYWLFCGFAEFLVRFVREEFAEIFGSVWRDGVSPSFETPEMMDARSAQKWGKAVGGTGETE